MAKKEKSVTSFRLTEETLARLDRLGEKRYNSRTGVLQQIVEEAYKNEFGTIEVELDKNKED